MREQAQKYAAEGWCVFPVKHKMPLAHWRDDSSCDQEQIAQMRWDEATGIGLDCGKSGIVVIDIDNLDSISLLADRLGWDPTSDYTALARTGSGGLHVYYRAGSDAVRNSASKVVPGVDVRGFGGYVVLPPSRHESGGVYEWIRYGDILPIPEKMVEVLNYREELPPQPPPEVRTHERWGLTVLSSEAYNVEVSQPGTRNSTLYEAALRVFSVVKGGHLDHDIAHLRLRQAGMHVGLEASEVDGTLSSAWNTAGVRHPEQAPQPVQTAPQQRRSFRTLSMEELENLPPPTWLLRDRLPEGMTWMYGEPGSGKTFLALDWAASVAATGLNVIYFVGEGVTGFARRVKAWRDIYRKDISTMFVVPQAPHLLEHQSVDMLRETVGQVAPSLIVIDTFARASVGGDENSARDVGLAIDVLDGLWKDMKVSSLIIHHSNKNGGVERGSSAMRGAADATWEVRPGLDGDRHLGSQVVCRKMKDAEPPSPFMVQLRGHEDSAYMYPSAGI